MTKLLNIDANAKTVKGIPRGFSTAVLYLAPYKTSGINVCPFAEKAGCWKTCLNTAGRGGMSKGGATFDANGITLPDNAIQRARIWRTQLWTNHREQFLTMLAKELTLFIRSAERKGLTPVVRLNGTSDIQWERIALPVQALQYTESNELTNFMTAFPSLQFYDYTKIPKRLSAELPSNYYLCLSYSEADEKYKWLCWRTYHDRGASLVMVARDEETKRRLLDEANDIGIPQVDGDKHDLRFLDPPGSRVVLKAKGSAKKETNGFVLD